MKITRNDSQQFAARQGRIGSYVMGGVFVVIGLFVMILMTSNTPGVQKQNSGVGIIFGAIFALAGVAVVIFSRGYEVVADRASGSLSIGINALVGGGHTQVAFSDVARVIETTSINMSQQSGTSTNKTIQLVMTNGDNVTIPGSSGGGFSLNGIPISMLMKHTDIGQALATFMNVPFEPLGFGSVAAIQNTVAETINAVQLARGGVPATLANDSSSAPASVVASVVPSVIVEPSVGTTPPPTASQTPPTDQPTLPPTV